MTKQLSLSKQPDILIKPIKRTDINGVVKLHSEFEKYLKDLDSKYKIQSNKKFSQSLSKDCFGRKRYFNGFVAHKNNKPIGYILYHFGYDPDEMEGRVVYIIDLFVTQNERKKGTGSLLMNTVAAIGNRYGAIAVYFGVWIKNKEAIAFYTKIGAKLKHELPFMKWDKKMWNLKGNTSF